MSCFSVQAGYPSPAHQHFFTKQEETDAHQELRSLLPPLHLVLGVGEKRLQKTLSAIEASRENQIRINRSNLLKFDPEKKRPITNEYWEPKQRFEVIKALCSLDRSIDTHLTAAKVCVIIAAILLVLAWVFLPWSALALPVSVALFATAAYTGLQALNLQHEYGKNVRALGQQEVFRAQEAIEHSPIKWIKKEADEIAIRSDAPRDKVASAVDRLYKLYESRYQEYKSLESPPIDLRKVVQYLFSIPIKQYEEGFGSLKNQGDPALRKAVCNLFALTESENKETLCN